MSRRTNEEIERALRAGSGGMEPGATRGDIPEQAAAAAARLTERIVADGLADIGFGPVDSPFGVLHAATTKHGLVRLAFPEEPLDSCLEDLAARLSPRIVQSPGSLDPVRQQLEEYFAGRRRRFDLKLDWALITPFARRVLRRTAAIPYGGHLSYAEVAAKAGSPRGARAAGNALGSNPIPIVIPCHRVLHSGGGLGGYGGGLDRKRFLLDLEGALPTRG